MQCEERLIFAIVAQAVRDYQRALRYLRLPASKKTESGEIAHERLKKDCEIFFRSKWYSQLCDLDAEELMATVKKRSYNGKIQGLSWQEVKKTEYPKKIMKATEIERLYGYSRGSISRLIHYPGQAFAFKLRPESRNSPVLIETEKFERWRQSRK